MLNPSIVYSRPKLVPSEKLVTNPRYEALLAKTSEEEEEPEVSEEEDEEAEQEKEADGAVSKDKVLALFEQWKHAFERIQKCRVELQKHRSSQREIESALKTALQQFMSASSQKSLAVAFQGKKRPREEGSGEQHESAFLCVEEQVQKKAISSKLLKALLIRELGQDQGETIYHLLDEERTSGGKRVSALKFRKKQPKASGLGE